MELTPTTDKILEILNEKKKVKISDLVAQLNKPEKEIMVYARLLESFNLIKKIRPVIIIRELTVIGAEPKNPTEKRFYNYIKERGKVEQRELVELIAKDRPESRVSRQFVHFHLKRMEDSGVIKKEKKMFQELVLNKWM